MRWSSWLLVAACSGSGGGPRPTPPAPPRDARVEVAAPPTEHECGELVAHAIELDARERPPDQGPTPADREALRTRLQPFAAECRSLPRATLQCLLAATTTAAFASCQDRPRSSTSNSSVAPGGIAPPAPRSP